MLRRNYAKDTPGLFICIFAKISVMTFLQYLNFINGRPVCILPQSLMTDLGLSMPYFNSANG